MKEHVSLVTERLTIQCLELCGARLHTSLLYLVKQVLQVRFDEVYSWTDSLIVLSWLSGNPRRFMTYVRNDVANIIDQILPERWQHVNGIESPADCASRGLYP